MKRVGVGSKALVELVRVPVAVIFRKFESGVFWSKVIAVAVNVLVPSVRVMNGEVANWRLELGAIVPAGVPAKMPVPLATDICDEVAGGPPEAKENTVAVF